MKRPSADALAFAADWIGAYDPTGSPYDPEDIDENAAHLAPLIAWLEHQSDLARAAEQVAAVQLAVQANTGHLPPAAQVRATLRRIRRPAEPTPTAHGTGHTPVLT